MNDAVTVHMNAEAIDIWALISDVTKIGRYSPETFEAEWLEGADGPAVGAKFRGHVKRNGIGPIYWTTCTVRECVPGQVFSFGVGASDKPLNIWRYELVATESGTDVTESFNLAKTKSLRLYWAVLGWSRGKTNRDDMRTTLERIKADAESSK